MEGDGWNERSRARVEILDSFPELVALGRDRLGELCERWLHTFEARAVAVDRIAVEDEDGRTVIEFQAVVRFDEPRDQRFWFPCDELIAYLIEEGIDPDHLRERLHARLRAGRERAGEQVYRLFSASTPYRCADQITWRDDDRGTVLVIQGPAPFRLFTGADGEPAEVDIASEDAALVAGVDVGSRGPIELMGVLYNRAKTDLAYRVATVTEVLRRPELGFVRVRMRLAGKVEMVG